ncbi:hypothetical protein N0V90_004132 [Kalmusia sp. IMI 367209]|nr:hypothetical protein N0V90_004132 [Kalmusia sp. IMI 367209]
MDQALIQRKDNQTKEKSGNEKTLDCAPTISKKKKIEFTISFESGFRTTECDGMSPDSTSQDLKNDALEIKEVCGRQTESEQKRLKWIWKIKCNCKKAEVMPDHKAKEAKHQQAIHQYVAVTSQGCPSSKHIQKLQNAQKVLEVSIKALAEIESGIRLAEIRYPVAKGDTIPSSEKRIRIEES